MASVFPSLSSSQQSDLGRRVFNIMKESFDKTSTMDGGDRMRAVAASTTTTLVDFFTQFSDMSASSPLLHAIPTFRSQFTLRATAELDRLRKDYLSGERGAAPASLYLSKTRAVYEYVRIDLGIKMHGSENYSRFVKGLGVEDVSIGQNISTIHEVRGHSFVFCSFVQVFSSGYPRWKDANHRCFAFRLIEPHIIMARGSWNRTNFKTIENSNMTDIVCMYISTTDYEPRLRVRSVIAATQGP